MFSNWKTGIHKMAVSLLVLACAGTASAGTLSPETWRSDVNQSATSLHRGEYAGSLKIVERTLAAMVEHLGAGSAENEMLGTVLTHKALANAGLGNVDQALWYWYIAQEISPAASKADLSGFGAPGEFLKRHLLTTAEPSSGGTTPARILKEVPPRFPPGASRFGISGDLVVHIIIDRNGQPTLPRIIHPLPAPTLSLVALEALKRWQFEPAKRNGEPVSFPFDLTVHYRL